jgi:hypothetical protein
MSFTKEQLLNNKFNLSIGSLVRFYASGNVALIIKRFKKNEDDLCVLFYLSEPWMLQKSCPLLVKYLPAFEAL